MNRVLKIKAQFAFSMDVALLVVVVVFPPL